MSYTSSLSGYTISLILSIQNSLFPIREHLYFSCYAEAFFGVSANHSSGHLVKLYATELNLVYGKDFFALHNLWLLHNTSFSHLN